MQPLVPKLNVSFKIRLGVFNHAALVSPTHYLARMKPTFILKNGDATLGYIERARFQT